MQKAEPEKAPTFRELFPEIPEDQLKEAEENFNRYIDVVLRIYERVRNDPEEYARFKTIAEEENRREGDVVEKD